MANIFSDPVIIALTAVIQLIIIALGIFATRAVVSLKNKVNIELGDVTENRIMSIITNVVRMVNQTVVDKMKELSPNGKLTSEQANRVYNQTIGIIKDILSSEYVVYLEEKYSSLDAALNILIEAAVAVSHEPCPIVYTTTLEEVASATPAIDRSNINIDVETPAAKPVQKSAPKKKSTKKTTTPSVEDKTQD